MTTTPFTAEVAADYRKRCADAAGLELDAWYRGQKHLKASTAQYLLEAAEGDLERARHWSDGNLANREGYYCSIASHAVRAETVARYVAERTHVTRAAKLRKVAEEAAEVELAARRLLGLV